MLSSYGPTSRAILTGVGCGKYATTIALMKFCTTSGYFGSVRPSLRTAKNGSTVTMCSKLQSSLMAIVSMFEIVCSAAVIDSTCASKNNTTGKMDKSLRLHMDHSVYAPSFVYLSRMSSPAHERRPKPARAAVYDRRLHNFSEPPAEASAPSPLAVEGSLLILLPLTCHSPAGVDCVTVLSDLAKGVAVHFVDS